MATTHQPRHAGHLTQARGSPGCQRSGIRLPPTKAPHVALMSEVSDLVCNSHELVHMIGMIRHATPSHACYACLRVARGCQRSVMRSSTIAARVASMQCLLASRSLVRHGMPDARRAPHRAVWAPCVRSSCCVHRVFAHRAVCIVCSLIVLCASCVRSSCCGHRVFAHRAVCIVCSRHFTWHHFFYL
jgi:hypothetical protein